jgi:uncharacterized membrane protein YfcA
MLPSLSFEQWLLAALAAFCVGFAKGGFSGVGLVTVLVMAQLFPAKDSTGVLLPLLICGDVMSVMAFHQHARWSLIRRMLPPTVVGIVVGYYLMKWISTAAFPPLIGAIVLLMVGLQLSRQFGLLSALPHSQGFAWGMGIWSGLATMLANAAGPVMALYFLTIDVPKFVLVGTSAWFFLIVNLFKVPFSAGLGLITQKSLLFNLLLSPMVALGIVSGRGLIRFIPQKLFEFLLMFFATVVALRLMGLLHF